MLNPLDTSLLMSVSHSPLDTPKLLISPTVNMDTTWFDNEFSQSIFDVVFKNALSELPTSPISIISKVKMSKPQVDWFLATWQKGKLTDSDITGTVEALRERKIIKEANTAMDECRQRVSKTPSSYLTQYTALGATMDFLVHEGETYDPTPSAPSNSRRWQIMGKWGDCVFDSLFEVREDDGTYTSGILNYGSIIWVGATKMGKSTSMYTLSSLSILRDLTDVVYISNEPTKDQVKWNIYNAILGMGGLAYDDMIKQVDRTLKIYQHIHSFETMKRILHWHRPGLAIMDSLDGLSFPQEAKNYRATEEQHRERAQQIRDIAAKYNTLLIIPANASETMQNKLRTEDIKGISSVMPLGSSWYQSLMDESVAFARDKIDMRRAYVKRVVNRTSGRMGEVWELEYQPKGAYYKGIGQRIC